MNGVLDVLRSAFLAVVVGVSVLGAGCRHFERATPGRTPIPLSAEIREPFRIRYPGFGLELELEERTRDYELYALEFFHYSEKVGDIERVTGHYYRSLRLPPGMPTPLVLVSPILAGPADNYLSCRVFSRWACADGLSAFYLHQEGSVLSSRRDGLGLELFFREDIKENLKALDLLVERPEIDASRLGTFGISLGAIKNVILISMEPRLSANVLCLGGCDLAEILLTSRERGVERYVEHRCEKEGISRAELADDIRANLITRPELVARSISNERVLLFLGSLDNKVPYKNGLLLKERLGDPETYVLAVGHYTGIIAAPYAARRGFAFLWRRFGYPDGPPLAAR